MAIEQATPRPQKAMAPAVFRPLGMDSPFHGEKNNQSIEKQSLIGLDGRWVVTRQRALLRHHDAATRAR